MSLRSTLRMCVAFELFALSLQAQDTAQVIPSDNAWVLVCSALVLLMTGPGLALFYGGLVRKKNLLSTMMQSFIMMGLMTLLWGVIGYSLAFAEGNAIVGGLDYVFLDGVGQEAKGTIPHLTFMVFQLMFAIITPALITGAFAERIKFSAMLLFMAVWAFVVYFPMAHMVWGPGGLMNAFEDGALGCLDFAGGTVVHISSGVSALICAIYIGKRRGYPNESMRPGNLPFTFIGACLLWIGWFGFNAGSALSASGLAAAAFVATHFGAAGGIVGWLMVEWLRDGKPSLLGGVTGSVAGLVGVTPAAGFVTPFAGFFIGVCAAAVCYVAVAVLKPRLGYDDSLDAFGVHGIGGTVGAILTGVFATRVVNDGFNGQPMGLLEGNVAQFGLNTVGAILTWVLAAGATYAILRLVDATVGLRVEEMDEIKGLDLTQHGEEAYRLEA